MFKYLRNFKYINHKDLSLIDNPVHVNLLNISNE